MKSLASVRDVHYGSLGPQSDVAQMMRRRRNGNAESDCFRSPGVETLNVAPAEFGV
jgi:hypothetical protein